MENNLVSICVTTFNRKEFLKLTLNSILAQTYKNIEVLVVDDCSNDGTKELIENKFLNIDKRIKYFRHENNKGLAVARNTAIINSKGKYFTFCDDDDLWVSNFIEEFVNIASKYNSNWCFCCGGKYKNMLGRKTESPFYFEGELKKLIKEGFTPPVSSQFYNLQVLKDIGGYNTNIKSGVDHDLWIKLAKINCNIIYISKALSIPNANSNLGRMTTRYDQRLSGIKNSLQIWKNDLEEMYDKKFFLDFHKAYIDREQSKFLEHYLRNFNLSMILRIKSNISTYVFLKILFKFLSKKFFFKIVPKIFISKKKELKIKPTLKINN
tara:strand:- start:7 stop:975 length:969 start_codon:yes stop_codon:yes gene_type:complete